ncbi:MerR family transcriptional regulator [Streptomyces caniscabiei]|uniref:MerR family transcriptional regulator n=1 Tax=Streptomyces caniscabiei TaxID=2746961 RepID=UPI000A36721C|nr:MerR family transcriptional regulator [Streptomyces caniscabiei]
MSERLTPGPVAPVPSRPNAALAPEPGAEPPRHGVTTGFLARRLGVSPTTLRSWDRRYGLGPAVRAEGRQRRWSPDDVAMLQEMCRLTAAGVPPAEAARAAIERARGRAAAEMTVVPPAARAGDVDHAEPAGPPALVPPPEPAGSPVPDAPPVVDAPHERAAPSVRARRGRSPASALPLGDVRQECRGLARAAVRLDAAAVQEQLRAVVRAHGLVVAWEEVMAPTLRAVGRKWESSGDRYVEVEHLLSWHISTTLRHVYLSAPPPGEAAPVLLACLPDEHHTLPLEALAAALAERHVPVLMLGGAVPAEALEGAVRRVAPAAVALWAQSRPTAALSLARRVAATRWGIRGARRHSPVLLCGPGWGRRTPEELLRPSGLHDAVTTLVPLSASTRP